MSKNLVPIILKWMFKATIVMIIATIVGSFIYSLCSCSRYCAKTYPCNASSVVRDSFITVINTETVLDSFYTYVPVDSTAIQAQVNCDENGKVIFKPVYYRDTKKEIELSVKNGWLLVRMDRYKDSIMNVVTRKERTISETTKQYNQVVQKLKINGIWKWLMVPVSLLLFIILLFLIRSFIVGKPGK